MTNGARRPPRTGRRVEVRRERSRHTLDVGPGNMLVDVEVPAECVEEGIQRCAGALARWKKVSLMAAMPEKLAEGKDSGFMVGTSDLDAMQVSPVAYGGVERSQDRDGAHDLHVLFRLQKLDGVSPDELSDAMTLMVLAPKVLRMFLSVFKPWHLSLFGIPGFEDRGPDDEQIAGFLVLLRDALVRWGRAGTAKEGE